MKLSKEINKILNTQMSKEFFNQHLYLSCSAYFVTLELEGFAKWFKLHAKEEEKHAMKLFEYIDDARGAIEMSQIDKPFKDFTSIEHVFEMGLAAEETTTASIQHIVELALKEKDHKTYTFMQWYIDEQLEEEDLFSSLLARVKFIGDDKAAMLKLDRELHCRDNELSPKGYHL